MDLILNILGIILSMLLMVVSIFLLLFMPIFLINYLEKKSSDSKYIIPIIFLILNVCLIYSIIVYEPRSGWFDLGPIFEVMGLCYTIPEFLLTMYKCKSIDKNKKSNDK